MKQSALERRIADLIRPVIEDKGYRLVAVSMPGPDLQIMAENPKTRNLGVDECAMLSREISAIMEVEDPIKGRYRLEISSPGIDRPLIDIEDFSDFAGFEAKIEINPPHEGQRRFRGRLRGLEESDVILETDTGLVSIPFAAIEKAKLVLTDELIRSARNKQEITKEAQTRNP